MQMQDKKKVIVDLIKWANTDGQNYSKDLIMVNYQSLSLNLMKLI